MASIRESFEECGIQLHHYTPQDEIYKEMFYLFANKKSNPKEPFEALRENNLNNNSNEFQWIYPRAKCPKRETCDVKHLYEEFSIPAEERMRIWMKIQLVDLWDKSNMNVMNSLSLQKIESADEVYELLSQEVSRLQELYVKCAKI
ncbi:hypothetical protein Glove_139g335 [Diversispora epigaea]|uniref:Uncharacterized protein n=1 Tax=Diversispora epigaea TaxID=1348612 RepID=A0A397J552_9GLOM|nr:hypothetical protein Glove_139g335 [Diversispora epigaea]